jgi:HEAT repeat protein
MLELLIAATGVELGKLVLEKVLDLGKGALEEYVKDFFKDCIKSGVTLANNAEALKKPMAEAVGFFIKQFIKELQFNDVADTSIDHYYKTAIKKFVQDKAVRPILGKAFEKDCRQIAYVQLQHIWTQQHQNDGYQFPEEFDWPGVTKQYVSEVRGIIKANTELRELLQTELLEDIARNTAQISPGFDTEKYRNSLQCSYGYLKLNTLDITYHLDAIKLWNMFIEQTVREALPPARYELPLDVKRQLQEQGQLEADLSPEALENYHRKYFQQSPKKILKAVVDAQRAVIVGDPGAGKSTLLQYLALEWAEGKTIALPLLIELQDYAVSKVNGFLEFFHHGRGVAWQFDQQQLHPHLLEYPTLVMFDGLDEVFESATQSAIIDDIIRFVQWYPKAKVLITSRIIGYNPERLQHAEFRHFTIQPLDTDEIHEFIERWYTLALDSDPDKSRLITRLKDAIANSKAIQNLADNPLLLTMMAILNRQQELPRDRADLYDQASRVLLYHWDVDHKQLPLPSDTIGRREKQEMLRLIAYEMQAGDAGLKGNLISAERLTRILTDYLCEQGFTEPREKANRLIQQLRSRNFILCDRGADFYGFIHRTFLEYFCAVEIVQRFEKQRTLTFEQLRDEVLGQHWQDETWNEVLRLICGMIDAKFAGELIEFLMELKIDQMQFLDDPYLREIRLIVGSGGFANLLLAADCLSEISNTTLIGFVQKGLLLRLKTAIEYPEIILSTEAAGMLVEQVAQYFSTEPDTLSWLKQRVQTDENWSVRGVAVYAIAEYFSTEPDTLSWLKQRVQTDENWSVRGVAVYAIAEYFSTEPDTLSWLKQRVQTDENWSVLGVAVYAIAEYFSTKPDTLPWLKQCVQTNENWHVRCSAVRAIAEYFSTESDTLPWLKQCAQAGENSDVRCSAVRVIGEFFSTEPDTLPWLKQCVQTNENWHVRYSAVRAIAEYFSTESDTLPWLKQCAQAGDNSDVRCSAVRVIGEFFSTDTNTLTWLNQHVQTDENLDVRRAAMETIAQYFSTDPNKFP